MVQRIPNYTNVTVNAGITLTASAWDGTKGGILFFRASGTVTNNGTITMSELGYRGGQDNNNNYSVMGYHGESYAGGLNGQASGTGQANAGAGGVD